MADNVETGLYLNFMYTCYSCGTHVYVVDGVDDHECKIEPDEGESPTEE